MHTRGLTRRAFRRAPHLRDQVKKLFVGGLAWATRDEGLREAFEQFGAVSDAKVITERDTGRSRGFGFVTFDDDAAADEAIAQMDADLSHPPELLLECVEALRSCDLVVGSRYVPGGSVDRSWPLWRKGLSAFGSLYAHTILRLPVRDLTSGFKLWRRSTLLGIPLQRVSSNGYAFQIEMTYLAHRMGYRIRELPFYFPDREWGRSKISFAIQIEAALRVWQLLFEYRDLEARSEHQP